MSGAVKICGLTRAEDVELVRDLGAEFAGFIFAESPRRIEPDTARELVAILDGSGTIPVGVFVDEDADRVRAIAERTGIRRLQLHGAEDAAYARAMPLPVIRALRVRRAADLDGAAGYPAEAFLLDAWHPEKAGGTGTRLPWDEVRDASLSAPVYLAGGLTPDNVGEAIRTVRPAGVDVSGGVEESHGRKDPSKVREFLEQARRAFEEEGKGR